DAIDAEGEGKQFAAFAWKYANIVAICLEEMKQAINYKSIAFYISRLDQLLMAYADTVMPNRFAGYGEQIQWIMTTHNCRVDKFGKSPEPIDRTQAVIAYLKSYIHKTIATGNMESLHDQILIDLFDAAI